MNRISSPAIASHTTVPAAAESGRALYYWLLLAIFFEYARPGAFVPGIEAAKLNSLIPLSLFVITLFASGMRPWGEIFGDALARWLTVFLLLVLLSVPFADVTLYAYDIFKKTLGYFFLFVMIARMATTTQRLRGVFWALLGAHIFLLAMNPVLLTNPSVRSYITGGTFLGDGNDFSLSLCILVPCTIELALGTRSKTCKITAFTLLAVLTMAIVATQSRGATLAVIAMFGYLWVASPRKGLTLAGIAVVGLVVALYAPDQYFSRMNTISTYEEDESAEGRIIAWKAGTRMALDNPVLGIGAGNFAVAFGSKYKPKDRNMPWITAHSMYFLVLGELGFPGILAYLAVILGNIGANVVLRRHLLKAVPPERRDEVRDDARMLYMLAASAIAFAIAGAFLSVAYYPHVFVLTGMLLAARCLARDRLLTIVPPTGRTVGARARARAHSRHAR